jgi:hypothetical protein
MKRRGTFTGLVTIPSFMFAGIAISIAISAAPAHGGWLHEVRLTAAPGASDLSSNNARCLSADAEGNLHLVWYDYRDGDGDIYYNRFNGVTWEAETDISSNGSASEHPSIAVDCSGHLHVVWIDHVSGGPDIYYKMSDGTNWTASVSLSGGADSCETPAIAVDSFGCVHVVWRDYRDGAWGIYHKMFDGDAWSPGQKLTDPAAYPRHASIAADDSQHIHLVWEDYRHLDWELYYKSFDGTSWGPDIMLTDDPVLLRKSSMVVDSHENVHVFWDDKRHGEYAIYHKVLHGNAWGPDEPVVQPSWNTSAPVAAAGDSGGLHLVWYDLGAGGNKEVFYREFDGASWGPVEQLSRNQAVSKDPVVAADSYGHPHVVWQDNRDGNFEIYWRSSYSLSPPRLVSIEPDSGLSYDKVHIDDLAGENFFAWARVWLQRGGKATIQAFNVVVESSTRIRCDLDLYAAEPGRWDVVVMNPDSQCVTLPSGFEVLPAPAPRIIAITPNTGVAYEGVSITDLAGSGFNADPRVWLERTGEDSVEALNVVAEFPSRITCDFSLGSVAPGTWNVVVMNRDGRMDRLLSGFQVMPGLWSEDLRLTCSGSTSSTSGPNGRCTASDHLGNLHTVWRDDRDGNWEIYYKKYDGVSWGPDQRLTNAANSSLHAAIAAGGQGDLHVVWDDDRDGNYEIYYKRYDGSAWLADERLTIDPANSQYPSVAADETGRVYVAWMDNRTGGARIYMKTFDGSSWLPDESIAPALEPCGTPTVAVDIYGHVHVAWYNADSNEYGLYYRMFDGINWSETHKVAAAWSLYGPTIAVDRSDRVHLAWHDARYYDEGYGYEIFYRSFDGLAWGPLERITEAPLNSVNASVAVDDGGKVHLVWVDKRDGNNEIYYKVNAGSGWGLGIRLTRASSESTHPHVAVTSDGRLHVVWQDKRHGPAEIYYKTRAPGDPAAIPGTDSAGAVAKQFAIAPNPVHKSARITFCLGTASEIDITIHDTTGRLVCKLGSGLCVAGTRSITWNGCDDGGSRVAPGVYFISVRTGDRRETGKVVLLK